MNDDDAPRRHERLGPDQRSVRGWTRWVVRKLTYLVAGFVLYMIAINTFAGYPQIHSETLNWIAVVVMSLVALALWIRDERRHDD